MFDRRSAFYRRNPYASGALKGSKYALKKAYKYRAPLSGFAYGALTGMKPHHVRDLAGSPLDTRVKTKSNHKLSKDVKRMRAQMTKLKKFDDTTTGRMTYRQTLVGRLVSAVNQQNVEWSQINAWQSLETALAFCKYFDPANPGTLVVGSPATGTYQRNILIDSMTGRYKVRNNYQVPVEVDLYLCTVKDDTSITPETAWTNSISDATNLTAITDLNQYPSDYNELNDLWKLKKVCSATLQSGQEKSVSHTVKSIELDPATLDNHALTFQKEYKSFGFLLVVKGVQGHDVSANEQCVVGAGVDFEYSRIFKITYSAGTNINFTHIVNSYDTPSNGAVTGARPIADNQSYSAGTLFP